MSEIDDLDALLAELNEGTSEEAEPVVEEIKEAPQEEAEVDVVAVLDELVEEDAPAPERPAPAKKRGRPRKTAVKPEPKVEVKEVEADHSSSPETKYEIGNALEEVEAVTPGTNSSVAEQITEKVVEELSEDDVPMALTEEIRQTTQAQTSDQKPKDIYVLQDAQIINGKIYRRGQKITYVPGDRFYQSQTDRHGNNWLDLVDDPEAQYAYFGKLIVEPDHWTGIPLGSTEGIEHPGLALAISKFAQEEYQRNGRPLD